MPQEQFIAWANAWEPPDTATLTAAESVIAKLG